MVSDKMIQTACARFFRGYDKHFVNELARLLILFGSGFYINNPKRLALFLTHVKAEIDRRRDGTVRMREWMNYSAAGLMQQFKFFRHHPKLAQKYGRTRTHHANQIMIANYAYANRPDLGNGDVDSGDGWRYRGWGILQTTGKANFAADLARIERVTGMVLHVMQDSGDTRWLENYTMGILAGMAAWQRLNMYASKSVDESTAKINRYTHSYAKRKRYYAEVKRIIDGVAV